MDLENKLQIIGLYYCELQKRYLCLESRIAQLTEGGCIDAKEYWKDGKYLYLLFSDRYCEMT